MKHKKTTIIIISLLIILNITLINAMPNSEITRVTQQIRPKITDIEPTFTEIETTVYYTPSCEDFESWCSPEKGTCFKTTDQILEFYPDNQNVQDCVIKRSGGWCCIPENHRGIYEEIKCQGSGVCEKCEENTCLPAIYSYSNIKPTQQDSIPITGDYERGRTRTQTDPKEKWTVAVNTNPTTDCYIPDGTVMYIDFGQENPWTGLYRAEDTGSAFEGECKMDIYTGVGEQAVNQARGHISGKHPDIYLLQPTQPSPPALSTTQLAESYTFITKQEYNEKIKTTDPKTTIELNKELSQAGIIVLPYSFTKTLNGIKHFYDKINTFSNEVLQDCSTLNYEQKAACAYKKAKDYEDRGIKITNCAKTQIPISKQHMQENQKINISGIIKKINKNQENIKLTIQQIHGEKINTTLNIPQQYHSTFRDEDNLYIELTNIKVQETNPLKTKYNETESTIRIQPPARDWAIEKNAQTIALNAADCQTTQNCICEMNLIETNQEYTLTGKTINTEKNTLITNIIFRTQDTTITNRIAPINDDPLVLAPNLLTPPWAQQQEDKIRIQPNIAKIEFKKGITNSLIKIDENYEPQLQKCKPTHKHTIFCAQPIKNHEKFTNTHILPENMNFSLKI